MATPATTRGLAKVQRRDASIEEDVRRLVARELHDRVAQTLTSMLVDIENFKSRQVSWGDVLQQLELVQSSTREVLASLRELLHDLRRDEQVGDSLVGSLAALIMRFEQRTQIKASLEIDPEWPEAMSPYASLNVYRIVEEALTNVRMHSGAQSVRVVLKVQSPNELALTVTDDGHGFDAEPNRPMGLGTIGMKERALFLGGWLSVEGSAETGTVVRLLFPTPHGNQASDRLQSSALLAEGMTA